MAHPPSHLLDVHPPTRSAVNGTRVLACIHRIIVEVGAAVAMEWSRLDFVAGMLTARWPGLVDISPLGCWKWVGPLHPTGYIRATTSEGRSTTMARLVYTLGSAAADSSSRRPVVALSQRGSMNVFECRMCHADVFVGEIPSRMKHGRLERLFLLLDARPTTATTSGFILVDRTTMRFVPAETSSAETYAAHWTTCPAIGRGEGIAWNRRHLFGFDVPTAP